MRKRQQLFELKKRDFDRENLLIKAQIDALQMQLANREQEFTLLLEEEGDDQKMTIKNQTSMGKLRHL
jgi:circadian clock protein KaiC